MESPYNGGDNTPTTHFMPPSKASSARNGLHLVESLAKGVPQKLPNIIGHCQGYCLLSIT